MESSAAQINFKTQPCNDDSRVVNGMSTLNAISDCLDVEKVNNSQERLQKQSFVAARLSSTGVIQ